MVRVREARENELETVKQTMILEKYEQIYKREVERLSDLAIVDTAAEAVNEGKSTFTSSIKPSFGSTGSNKRKGKTSKQKSSVSSSIDSSATPTATDTATDTDSLSTPTVVPPSRIVLNHVITDEQRQEWWEFAEREVFLEMEIEQALQGK